MYQYQKVLVFLNEECNRFGNSHLTIEWEFNGVTFSGEVLGSDVKFSVSMDDGLHFPETTELRERQNKEVVVELRKLLRANSHSYRFELSEDDKALLANLKLAIDTVISSYRNSQMRSALFLVKRE